MGLSRQQFSQVYRPIGIRPIWTGNNWASGGKIISPSGQFDLTYPARGVRIVVKGRMVIGTAAFTTSYPEGLLGLISRVYIYGVNGVLGSQTTLCDASLADLWDFAHLCGYRMGHLDVNAAVIAVPSMPYPATYNPTNNTGTYDFRLVFDVPFHPFAAPEVNRPGFAVRGKEWKNTLTVWLEFGAQAGAGATGFLGVSGGTSTIVFSSFGSGAGSPSVDVYSLPFIMGADVAQMLDTPGVITRVGQAINAPLQAAGTGVNLLTLQNRSTPRLFFKNGTLGTGAAFATLSDTNVSGIGLQYGGSNKNIRIKADYFPQKFDAIQAYERDPIQGCVMYDFMESQNSDSAYPADTLDASSQLQLVGDVVGVANGYGIIMQEQQLLTPQGSLYGS